jgi:hypothetical protein
MATSLGVTGLSTNIPYYRAWAGTFGIAYQLDSKTVIRANYVTATGPHGINGSVSAVWDTRRMAFQRPLRRPVSIMERPRPSTGRIRSL